MAKIGEGDARWIVSDRKDGTNCNSWHWEERDLADKTHEDLKAKFKDLPLVDQDGMVLSVKELSDISGDVTVAQRKGKIMCYFDLKFTVKYKGTVGGEDASGKLVVPDVDHDSYDDDFDINVAAGDSTAASVKAEQWARKGGRQAVRAVIVDYFAALYKEHRVGTQIKAPTQSAPNAGMQVPQGGAPPAAAPLPVATPEVTTPAPAAPAAAPAPVKAKTASAPKKAEPLKVTWKMQWRCPAQDLWAALTSEERASMYTRARAKIDPRPTGAFEFLGGLISGYYVDVVPMEKITMQWRLGSWDAGVFSSVVMTLSSEEPGVTRLEFAQVGIPDGEVDRVRQGWQQNFWDPIKMLFGYSVEFL